MGEAMSYWDFFPAEDGWGRVPMWGFAEVERSEAEGVEAGTRGLRLPAALLAPGRDARRRRRARLRRRLAAPGGAALRLPPLPGDRRPTPSTGRTPRTIQMLLRPLFFTSFLIDDQLADEGLTERGPIVISSASSKTAIAAAFLLAQREGVELVGLTSPRKRRVRRGPGDLRPHRHLRRDRLARARARHLRRRRRRRRGAPRGPLPLRRRARPQHGRRASPTGRSSAPAAAASCPARRPTFFFAPDRVVKRSEDWGRGRARAAGRRRLAPVLRVDRRLAGDDPRRGLRGGRRAPTSTCSRAASSPKTAHVLSL